MAAFEPSDGWLADVAWACGQRQPSMRALFASERASRHFARLGELATRAATASVLRSRRGARYTPADLARLARMEFPAYFRQAGEPQDPPDLCGDGWSCRAADSAAQLAQLTALHAPWSLAVPRRQAEHATGMAVHDSGAWDANWRIFVDGAPRAPVVPPFACELAGEQRSREELYVAQFRRAILRSAPDYDAFVLWRADARADLDARIAYMAHVSAGRRALLSARLVGADAADPLARQRLAYVCRRLDADSDVCGFVARASFASLFVADRP